MDFTAHRFDPFIRLHDAEEFAGIGVGLAIMGNIIDRHHGRVWAHAAPNQEATFSFTLSKPDGEPEVRKASPPQGP